MENKELNARGNFISDCCQGSNCQPTTNQLGTTYQEGGMIDTTPWNFNTRAEIVVTPSLESQLKDLKAQIEIVELKIKLAKLESELASIKNTPIITYPSYPYNPTYPFSPNYPSYILTCEVDALPSADLSDIASATSADVGPVNEEICKRLREYVFDQSQSGYDNDLPVTSSGLSRNDLKKIANFANGGK